MWFLRGASQFGVPEGKDLFRIEEHVWMKRRGTVYREPSSFAQAVDCGFHMDVVATDPAR